MPETIARRTGRWLLPGVLLALAPAAAAQVQAQVPAQAPPTAAQRARLDAMFAAADALDEGADPAAYRRAFEQVLAYGRTLYPADHPMLAWLEAEQATADYLQGDVKGAEARLARISAVLDAAGPEWRQKRMEIANAQVVIYLTLSDFERGTALSEQVLEWRIATSGGKPSTALAAAWGNLANAQIRNGETARGIASARQAIAINQQLDPIPANAAPQFANLVTFLYAAGRLEEAAEQGRKTQAQLEAFLPAGHPFLSVNLNTLARILTDLGRLDEAESVARKAVDIAHARFGESQQTMLYVTTLAGILAAQGKADEAQTLARTAAARLTADLGAESDRTLLARETLAQALAAGADRAGALAELEQTTAIRTRLFPAHHRDRISSHDRLAITALDAGDRPRALAAQAEAQRLRAAAGTAEDADALVGEARLAAIEVASGQDAADSSSAATTTGLARARAAAERLDRRLQETEATGARPSGLDRTIRSGFGWAMEAAAMAGDAALAFDLAQPVVEGAAGQAARAAERRAALDDPALAGLLRAQQDAAGQLQILLDRQLRLAGLGAAPERIAALEQARRAAAARFAETTAQLAAAAPALARDERSERLSLARAQAALGADEALLVAAPGPGGLVVIAASRTAAQVVHSADSRHVAALVQTLRQGLERPGGFDHAASAALRAMIVPDAVAGVIAGHPRLLVASGGALASLPFAVLASGTAQRPHWLVQDHALVTLPALSALSPAPSGGAQPGQPARRINAFLALGAPLLGGAGPDNTGPESAGWKGGAVYRSAANARKVADLPPLPASAAELAALGKALSARSSTVLTGAQATEAALRSADLTAVDVLALSTHGLVAGEIDGLDEPALVLTPALRGPDAAPAADTLASDTLAGDPFAGDGLLTADEIMRLRLAGAWVVLSACNTAAGSGADGGGLAGLARAFLHAGAGNLLVSHWAVRDDAAARLSVATLDRYARGADPAQALRRAMLGMAQGRDAALRDPALWAPFVLVGR